MNSANKDVLVTVVVIVSDGDAIVETRARQSGPPGNILEVTVAIVLEEPIGVLRRALFQSRDVSSVGEIDIEVAIVVVVEQGYSAGHGFGGMTLRRLRAVQFEVDRLVICLLYTSDAAD